MTRNRRQLSVLGILTALLAGIPPLADGGTRRPNIVFFFSDDHAAQAIGSMALNVDFAPTLLEIAGAPFPEKLHGRSLLPLLRGERPNDWRTSFYYRFYETAYGLGPMEGVRTTSHKLIRYGFGDCGAELYDLQADPAEMHNRFTDPTAAEVVEGLQRELERRRQELGAPGF